MFKIDIVTHYDERDTEMGGDYVDITVTVTNDDEVIFIEGFGDYYHNKAEDIVEGFVKGFTFLANQFVEKVVVNKTKKADWKW